MNTDESLGLNRGMDLSFACLAEQVGNGYRQRLLFERRMTAEELGAVQRAATIYFAACLEMRGSLPTEDALFDRFLQVKNILANLTPNGVLLPKREYTAEYNLLHKAVADVLQPLLPEALIKSAQSLMMFRIVEGSSDDHRDRRPYATSKVHSDIWAGDPLDAVTLIIPIFGDPANITVKFFEMPIELEHEYMKPLADYDQASGIPNLKAYDDLTMSIGSIYFFDARLLHQTARLRPGFRVSLDFRIRRRLPPECNVPHDTEEYGSRQRNPEIDYATWRAIGRERLVVIPESCEEARAKHGAAANTTPLNATPIIISLTHPHTTSHV